MYHALVKEQERARKAGNKVAEAAAAAQLEQLGGINTYQRASIRGEAFG